MIRAIVQDDLIIGYRDSKDKLYHLSYEDFILQRLPPRTSQEDEHELVDLAECWCCENKVAVPYLFTDSPYPFFIGLDSRRDSWVTGEFDLWRN